MRGRFASGSAANARPSAPLIFVFLAVVPVALRRVLVRVAKRRACIKTSTRRKLTPSTQAKRYPNGNRNDFLSKKGMILSVIITLFLMPFSFFMIRSLPVNRSISLAHFYKILKHGRLHPSEDFSDFGITQSCHAAFERDAHIIRQI